MPVFCTSLGCFNNSSKKQCKARKISFHKFPLNDQRLLGTWLHNLRRDNFKPNKNSVLCSDHFSPECFTFENDTKRKRLKFGAVPTLFTLEEPKKRTACVFGAKEEVINKDKGDNETINGANNSCPSLNDLSEQHCVKKRMDYLSWSDYFMAVAFLTSMRSKDPNTQVGACIVNHENKIVAVGYNGMPFGCSDDELPWAREGLSALDTKYPYVCHAEMNAILNKNTADVKNCTIYVALFPCNECAKLIIQSGIKDVVYMSDKYHDTTSSIAARTLFDMADVKYRQYIPSRSRIEINFGLDNPLSSPATS